MAQQPPPIHFEDIPLAQARTMGRGPGWTQSSTTPSRKKSPPPGVAQGAPIDQAQEAIAPNTPEIPPQSPVVDPGLLALLAEGAIGEGTGDVSQQTNGS